jgi:hypothetical protein
MNCLLMRELKLECVARLWDTLLAEEGGFDDFFVYVCAAFLVMWSKKLEAMEFQEIVLFIQSVPTEGWGEEEIEGLLSQAHVLRELFQDSHC